MGILSGGGWHIGGRVRRAPRKLKTRTPKKKRAYRIPSEVSLGRGFHVFVAIVSQAEVKKRAGSGALGETAGLWDDETETIYIDETLPVDRQWETYWHELGHAVHDVATIDRGGI